MGEPVSAPRLPLAWADLAILSWMPTPAWVFDVDVRRIVWANEAGLELWSAASLSELCARDYSDMSEAAVTRFRAALDEMAAGKVLHEQWTLYPRGQPKTVSVTRVAIRREDGAMASLQQAQPAACVDPQMLRGVEALHHTNVRVALFREDGAAVMQNPSAIATFGALVDRGGDAFASLFVDADEPRAAREVLGEGAPYSAEVELRTQRGPSWHGLDARHVLDPVTGSRLVLINARDIQDRRVAEDALRRSVESQKHFLASMSHEIRTPLNSVIGFVDILRSTPLTEQQRRYVDNAYVSSQHLLALVSNVLDLSKVEADQLEIGDDELDLEEVLLEALVIASTRVRESVAIDYEIADLDSLVRGDPLRIKQIVVNLLGNAAKFTERGTIRLRLAPPARQAEDTIDLAIVIEDTGIGIAQARLGELFAPFRQVHGARFGGTGLGLYLSRSFARRMGGDIEVESAVGRGTRFTVKLSLRKGRRRDVSALAGKRVMLITSDEDTASALAPRLAQAGATLVRPQEATIACALRMSVGEACGASPDAIVLDLDVSPASRSLAGVLRELHPAARIVALVATPDGEEAPVDAILSKPFTFHRLAKLLGGPASVVAPFRARDVRGMKVLVVEDVEMNIGVLQELFQLWFGIGFAVARDGEEAIEKVRADAFDLVLMDLSLPRLDGIEATRKIRALGVSTPIVALTANALSEDIESARAAGMDGYLTKPVRKAELERVLFRHAPVSAPLPLSQPPRLSCVPPSPIQPSIRIVPESRPDLVETARRHLGSMFGPERGARLLASSIRSARGILAEMERARDEDDREALVRALHALKGVLQNSGLTETGTRVAALEQRLRSGAHADRAELDQVATTVAAYAAEQAA
jgi:signal transduction histidine kinase/CheY-like chemotaxis protein